jgi:hypothetical protein
VILSGKNITKTNVKKTRNNENNAIENKAGGDVTKENTSTPNPIGLRYNHNIKEPTKIKKVKRIEKDLRTKSNLLFKSVYI